MKQLKRMIILVSILTVVMSVEKEENGEIYVSAIEEIQEESIWQSTEELWEMQEETEIFGETESEPETEEETGETETGETETEEADHRIQITEIRLKEDTRYYDGTDAAELEAKVYGLPDGMELELSGKAQQSDAGIWQVEPIVMLYGENSENYIPEIEENTDLKLTILPRPLSIQISDARKSYYSDAELSNLVFEEEEILKVTGFLEQDCQGSVPLGFEYPLLTIDEHVLQKDSPMYRDGEEIRYEHAVILKEKEDGTISGNPTANYTFYMEEMENVSGGTVILSPTPILEDLDYTVYCPDSEACRKGADGTLWIREGAELQMVPTVESGFTEGKRISNIRRDGTEEISLVKRNEKGEIIADSQIRSISWRVDKKAPECGWTIDGKEKTAKEDTYVNYDTQVACKGLTEAESGLKSVEMYAAYGEEDEIDGEELYRRKNGEWKKTDRLLIDREGVCRVWIRLEDQVGNISYKCSGNIITDRTAPQLWFENIVSGSANKWAVEPICSVRDENLKKDSFRLTLTGYQNGEKKVIWKEERPDETCLIRKMEDLPRKREWDDVYLLYAEAEDLAGNRSAREVRFSVNRFGSVYFLDEETKKQNERFYITQSGDLRIYEVNVDYLTESEILLGWEGETRKLKKEIDYTVEKTGTDNTWKEYCYTVSADCFQKEGRYYLICSSEDRAWNMGDNRMGKQKIEFAVDKSAPQILMTGLEDKGTYQEREKTVYLECRDNLGLQEITIWVNGKEVVKNAEEEQKIVLTQGKQWQTIRVTAVDKAGNKKDTGELYFWLNEKETDVKPFVKIQKNREKEDEREVPVSEEEKTDRFAKGGDKKVSERIEKQEKTEEKKLEILAGIAVFTVLLAIFLIRKREK